MPLVTLDTGTSQWPTIKSAALVLWRASLDPSPSTLCANLQPYFPTASLHATEFHTAINMSRRAVLVSQDTHVTIAFEGSDGRELIKNLWSMGKGPNFWDLPYPVFEGGNRVHSFFRDMWHAMRGDVFGALDEAVRRMRECAGSGPERVVVTGFSQGGGVSTLAFTDILQYIRCTYGANAPDPQSWAADGNLGHVLQHITFAALGAADQGYHAVLNGLYERYSIRAWDFMNHEDKTRHVHDLAFRSWRGHRYILPDAVVRHCDGAFGSDGHLILGYLKAAEWMEENATDQVKSEYSY
ncbi:hypothetical protein BDU57DRAFT_510070 [Ampelomyces quisqualis]|uniref:Fungal lipase-type domain-containing protein n=1 Tax=Ampelomyces quisqualis TaxID=50730 RepID=A0A6A5QZV3_AMPQU|nr:hypothetical protein BDU57DRAFT_510070 [Ampelomyces quisqualis]